MEHAEFLTAASRQYAAYLHEAFRYGLATGDQVLQALKEAEEVLHKEMEDMTILGSFEAVSRRQQLTSPQALRELYSMAFDICDKLWRVPELWGWVQLAKARSLSSQLGVHSLIPAELRDRTVGDDEARELIHQEEQTAKAITAAQEADRLRLRGDLYRIHQQMAQHKILKYALEVKNGTPVSWGQVGELAAQIRGRRLGSNVVTVDWVDLRGSFWLVVSSSADASRPHLEWCNISVDNVVSWKRQWLDPKPNANFDGESAFEDEDAEEEDDDFSLRTLDRLVAPLSKLTAKDDLLVFVPTGILHSIPLHALWIEDQTPAIMRNPIVFCASLTVFSQCCRRAAETMPLPLPPPKHHHQQREHRQPSWNMVAVLEDGPSCRFPPSEREDVYQDIPRLAQRHGATWSTGIAVTRQFFAEAIQQSTLFHYHGHCELDRDVLADQSLQLGDGPLPAREVFGMTLRSPHITLVACESAMQGITTGNEPLGLVTGLLCAGAGSVLGTLWPTPSGTGRFFSDAFYVELESQRKIGELEGSSGVDMVVVDLAVALQKAVRAVRRDANTRKPYHWAAFVLHGAWFMNLRRL
ncbi:CHAT domain-containing protein [Immersiella caudata]|uniref:CHAT domain-containing protein n=1 Tax=Immersiella caudata TaxID=314043 RepID=A0AA39XHG3_9PEZI|nr:CHAT domain-containing protein [Immersiella caudata]